MHERRRRNDTIEVKLGDIRAQLNASSQRMDAIEGQLDDLRATNAVIREHIEATCEVARSASILIRPVIWVATRVRALTIWIAAFAAAVIGILTLGERTGWW